MAPPRLSETLQLLEQYALAENRLQAAEELSSQLDGKTSAFLAGALYVQIYASLCSDHTI